MYEGFLNVHTYFSNLTSTYTPWFARQPVLFGIQSRQKRYINFTRVTYYIQTYLFSLLFSSKAYKKEGLLFHTVLKWAMLQLLRCQFRQLGNLVRREILNCKLDSDNRNIDTCFSFFSDVVTAFRHEIFETLVESQMNILKYTAKANCDIILSPSLRLNCFLC